MYVCIYIYIYIYTHIYASYEITTQQWLIKIFSTKFSYWETLIMTQKVPNIKTNIFMVWKLLKKFWGEKRYFQLLERNKNREVIRRNSDTRLGVSRKSEPVGNGNWRTVIWSEEILCVRTRAWERARRAWHCKVAFSLHSVVEGLRESKS